MLVFVISYFLIFNFLRVKTSIQLLKGSDNGKMSYWSSSFTLIDLFIDVLFTRIKK